MPRFNELRNIYWRTRLIFTNSYKDLTKIGLIKTRLHWTKQFVCIKIIEFLDSNHQLSQLNLELFGGEFENSELAQMINYCVQHVDDMKLHFVNVETLEQWNVAKESVNLETI